MNIYNLVNKLEFTGNEVFYVPPDPFNIYFRLATLYLKANGRKSWLRQREIVKPHNLFLDNEIYSNELGANLYPLHFIKWVLQEIPKAFWKFNVLIDINKDRLLDSSDASNKKQIWINMHGVKNKLKQAIITNNVLQDLQNKVFYLPTYEEIVQEVPKWGDYKYEYGSIKDQLLKGVNI